MATEGSVLVSKLMLELGGFAYLHSEDSAFNLADIDLWETAGLD